MMKINVFPHTLFFGWSVFNRQSVNASHINRCRFNFIWKKVGHQLCSYLLLFYSYCTNQTQMRCEHCMWKGSLPSTRMGSTSHRRRSLSGYSWIHLNQVLPFYKSPPFPSKLQLSSLLHISVALCNSTLFLTFHISLVHRPTWLITLITTPHCAFSCFKFSLCFFTVNLCGCHGSVSTSCVSGCALSCSHSPLYSLRPWPRPAEQAQPPNQPQWAVSAPEPI